jgi:hypothetical protein
VLFTNKKTKRRTKANLFLNFSCPFCQKYDFEIIYKGPKSEEERKKESLDDQVIKDYETKNSKIQKLSLEIETTTTTTIQTFEENNEKWKKFIVNNEYQDEDDLELRIAIANSLKNNN